MLIDGTAHNIPGRKMCWCATFGHDCPKCGGYMHSQAIYGLSTLYVCEDCGREE